MIKHISLYLLFFLITYSYCSPCTEKIEILPNETERICESLSTTDDNFETSCIYDFQTRKCKEVTCSSLPYGECEKFVYKLNSKTCYSNPEKKICELLECSQFPLDKCTEFKSKNHFKRCLPNSDYTECQYQSCLELNQNCEGFITGNADEMCFETSHGEHVKAYCHIYRCTEKQGNCSMWDTSNYPQYTCVNETGGEFCQIRLKKCEELDPENCYLFGTSDRND